MCWLPLFLTPRMLLSTESRENGSRCNWFFGGIDFYVQPWWEKALRFCKSTEYYLGYSIICYFKEVQISPLDFVPCANTLQFEAINFFVPNLSKWDESESSDELRFYVCVWRILFLSKLYVNYSGRRYILY